MYTSSLDVDGRLTDGVVEHSFLEGGRGGSFLLRSDALERGKARVRWKLLLLESLVRTDRGSLEVDGAKLRSLLAKLAILAPLADLEHAQSAQRGSVYADAYARANGPLLTRAQAVLL